VNVSLGRVEDDGTDPKDRLSLTACCMLFGSLGPIATRDAFGGALLCVDDIPFALYRAGDLFMRAEGVARGSLQGLGCESFLPFPGKTLRLHYYRVPSAWLAGDADRLRRYAAQSIDAIRALIASMPEPGRFRARRIDLPES